MSIFAWALIIIGAGIFLTAATLVLCAALIAYISTHPPRRPMQLTPASFGADFEEIEFPAQDGVTLSGWLVPASAEGAPQAPARPRGAIILCHGMMETREDTLPWAETLWEEGFALLLFDFRAFGRSGGDRCTAGYHETHDLIGALDYLTSRSDMAGLPYGVFGFSMGGATAIMVAAEDSRIQAVATLGAYATLDSAIDQRCRKHFGPFGPPVATMTRWFGKHTKWYPVETSSVNPIQAVPRLTPRPLLILHGIRDNVILPDDAHALRAAAGNSVTLYILPHTGHSDIHYSIKDDTQARLAEFFCANLHCS